MTQLRTLLVYTILTSTLWGSAVHAEPKAGSAMPATPVITYKATLQTIADDIEALGTLRANESVDITSTVTENISALHFSDGQRVEKGDPLVEMTSHEEHAQIDEMRVTMEEARKQFKRATELVKDRTLSPAIADARKRDYETAQAKLVAMESRLNDRLILAPFSGVLGLRNASVGTLLQPGTKITTLDDDSIMKLDFNVPATYLGVLKEGLELSATSDAYPERSFNGKVTALDGRMDDLTRGITVRATIPNTDHALKSGLMMLVKVKGRPRQALMIPEGALVAKGSDQFVFVTDDSKEGGVIVNQRKVTIGTRIAGKAEIIAGIKQGEHVVTHGTMMLSDGQKTRILGEESAKTTASQIIKASQSATNKKD